MDTGAPRAGTPRASLGLLVLAAAAREDRLDACGDEGEGGAGGGGVGIGVGVGAELQGQALGQGVEFEGGEVLIGVVRHLAALLPVVDGRRVLLAKGTAESQRGQVERDLGRFGLGRSVGVLRGTGERMVWKDGSLPGHHAMVIMLPDSDLAVIVLQNAFHLLRAEEFQDAAFGVARMLSGVDPGTTSTDPTATVLPWATTALAALLLLCVAAPALRRLPGRRAAARARSRRRIVATTTATATAALTLAALLWRLPSTLGGTVEMALLWLPDLGWSLVAAIGLALLLAVERTALAALDLRRQRSG